MEIGDTGGIAFALANYDEFVRVEPTAAWEYLDAMARSSRRLLVAGKTLIALVHTKDPELEIPALGALTAWWNQAEFVRDKRGRTPDD